MEQVKITYHKILFKNNIFRLSQEKAFQLAKKGIIPQKCFNHNTEMQDVIGNTIVFYLVAENINPPKIWIHRYNLLDKNGYNVASIFAWKGIVPPKIWWHKSDLHNEYRYEHWFLI